MANVEVLPPVGREVAAAAQQVGKAAMTIAKRIPPQALGVAAVIIAVGFVAWAGYAVYRAVNQPMKSFEAGPRGIRVEYWPQAA